MVLQYNGLLPGFCAARRQYRTLVWLWLVSKVGSSSCWRMTSQAISWGGRNLSSQVAVEAFPVGIRTVLPPFSGTGALTQGRRWQGLLIEVKAIDHGVCL